MSERLVTRQFLLMSAVALGLFLNYQSLNVLTPYYLAVAGGSSVAVGLVTAAFMIAATLSSLAVGLMPLRRDFRWPLIGSLLLLCLPAFLFPLITNVPLFLAASALRGIGFGAAGVLIGTMVATIAPPSRRGLAIGILGMITSGCAIVGQSGTLLLAGRIGFTATFILIASLTILTVGVIVPLPGMAPRAAEPEPKFRAYAKPRMLMPALTLLPVCMVYGGVISFAPLHLRAGPAESSALFFLIIATAIPGSRLMAGWLLDHIAFRHIFVVGLVLGTVGMLLLGSSLTRPAIIAAAILFGTCFGTLASGAQIEITRRVPVAMYAVANGIFSSSWNAGMGIGGVAFGFIAAATGYGTMFKISSVFLLVAGLVLLIDHRFIRPSRSEARTEAGVAGVTSMEETAGEAARA